MVKTDDSGLYARFLQNLARPSRAATSHNYMKNRANRRKKQTNHRIKSRNSKHRNQSPEVICIGRKKFKKQISSTVINLNDDEDEISIVFSGKVSDMKEYEVLTLDDDDSSPETDPAFSKPVASSQENHETHLPNDEHQSALLNPESNFSMTSKSSSCIDLTETISKSFTPSGAQPSKPIITISSLNEKVDLPSKSDNKNLNSSFKPYKCLFKLFRSEVPSEVQEEKEIDLSCLNDCTNITIEPSHSLKDSGIVKISSKNVPCTVEDLDLIPVSYNKLTESTRIHVSKAEENETSQSSILNEGIVSIETPKPLEVPKEGEAQETSDFSLKLNNLQVDDSTHYNFIPMEEECSFSVKEFGRNHNFPTSNGKNSDGTISFSNNECTSSSGKDKSHSKNVSLDGQKLSSSTRSSMKYSPTSAKSSKSIEEVTEEGESNMNCRNFKTNQTGPLSSNSNSCPSSSSSKVVGKDLSQSPSNKQKNILKNENVGLSLNNFQPSTSTINLPKKKKKFTKKKLEEARLRNLELKKKQEKSSKFAGSLKAFRGFKSLSKSEQKTLNKLKKKKKKERPQNFLNRLLQESYFRAAAREVKKGPCHTDKYLTHSGMFVEKVHFTNLRQNYGPSKPANRFSKNTVDSNQEDVSSFCSSKSLTRVNNSHNFSMINSSNQEDVNSFCSSKSLTRVNNSHNFSKINSNNHKSELFDRNILNHNILCDKFSLPKFVSSQKWQEMENLELPISNDSEVMPSCSCSENSTINTDRSDTQFNTSLISSADSENISKEKYLLPTLNAESNVSTSVNTDILAEKENLELPISNDSEVKSSCSCSGNSKINTDRSDTQCNTSLISSADSGNISKEKYLLPTLNAESNISTSVNTNILAEKENSSNEIRTNITEHDKAVIEISDGEESSSSERSFTIDVGTNVYVPDGVSFTGPRPIIIDGSNVAFGHGLSTRGRRIFSSKGIEICVKFFVNRGHKVIVFIPLFRRWCPHTMNPEILQKLSNRGLITFTPSRKIDSKLSVPYDDRYIVQCAVALGGVIVSTDNYRDLLRENPTWKSTIEKRLLMFTFVGDMLMFPQDPLGRHGPKLDKFLHFPR